MCALSSVASSAGVGRGGAAAAGRHRPVKELADVRGDGPEVVGGKAMYRKHFLPQMWDANVRRLRRSDPDLFDWLEKN